MLISKGNSNSLAFYQYYRNVQQQYHYQLNYLSVVFTQHFYDNKNNPELVGACRQR